MLIYTSVTEHKHILHNSIKRVWKLFFLRSYGNTDKTINSVLSNQLKPELTLVCKMLLSNLITRPKLINKKQSINTNWHLKRQVIISTPIAHLSLVPQTQAPLQLILILF